MNIKHPSREEIQLDKVLAALGSPIRLAAIRKILTGEPCPCYTILPQVTKSTMTHHFRILRESGIVQQHHNGRVFSLSIRRDDLEARFPGLMSSVIQALRDDALINETLDQYPDSL